MLTPPFLENENQRLAAMNQALCAFVPREERFDRITRTVQRLLKVPIALVSIVDENLQWFRSAQGLDSDGTPRDISFCGHAIAHDQVLLVPDARHDDRFSDNPLVTGPPHIRAYLGVPLSIAPGIRVGTLCALSDKEHSFRHEDVLGMMDLAAMAEAELKLDTLTNVQKRLLTRLSVLERRAALEPATGCWNVRGFRQLVAMAVEQAQQDGSTLALCYVRVKNLAELAGGRPGGRTEDGVRQLLAQVLRRRLPQGGALAALGNADFCALIPGPTPLAVEEGLAQFTFPQAHIESPGLQIDLRLELRFGMAMLHELDTRSPATEVWGRALANLNE